MATLVTPTRSFVGGLLLLLPVFLAPRLLSAPYGISGALHRTASIRGRSAAAVGSTAGLALGGAVVAWLLPASLGAAADEVGTTGAQWARWVVSGLLVGAGSKLANGCTSGHMLSGLTRQSPRSLVSTALFFLFGGLTASLAPAGPAASILALSPGPLAWDWSVGPRAWFLISGALLSSGLASIPARLAPASTAAAKDQPARASTTAAFLLSVSFALGLAVSGMLSSRTILAFLTPFSPSTTAWNPSLLFLAAVLPLSVALYRGPTPARDKQWREPALWLGAALFGVGWGLSGVCPGPGIVNLGTAVVRGGAGARWWVAWVGACVAGGKAAEAVWARL